MNKRTFKQLAGADRGQIEALVKEGLSQTEIARRLKVNKSSISRELTCHSTPHGYFAKMAQARHEHKRKQCRPKEKMSNPEICAHVLERIYRGWSPETIAGKLGKEIKSGKRPENFYSDARKPLAPARG